jgi:cysteine desulfurase
MDPEVVNAMLPYFLEQHGNPSSVHHHGRTLRAAIEKARKTIAELIGAAPSEIFFTSGGTEADNQALKATVMGGLVRHILTTQIEHHAITHCAEELEKAGLAKVTWLPVDGTGAVKLDALEDSLRGTSNALVSLMHANNELGTLNDLAAIGEICERHGALFHSDTVQAMGNVRYSLKDMKVHMLSAAAHKFYGPKGVGFMYVKGGTKIPAFVHGGGQERNMRAGTENLPGIMGMAYALEKCYRTLDAKTAHLQSLKNRLRDGLRRVVPGVEFNGAQEPERSLPTVLNVAFPGTDSESMILFNLDMMGVSCSGGSACTSGSVKGSHVLAGIGCSPERAANSVRFSFGVQNTPEEIDFVIEQVGKMVGVGV